jgi:cobalt-zinc-cadmium efflux system outer membrane protein
VEVSRYVQALAEAQLRLADARLRLTVYTGLEQLDPSPPPGARLAPPALRGSLVAANQAAGKGEIPMLRSNQAEAGFWTAARERAVADKNAPFFVLLYGGRGDYGEARLGAGIGYTFPVARRNQGEIARAEAEHTRAQQLRPALQRVALARLQADFENINTALQAVREMEANGIPAAENAVNATLESFRAGKAELVRVIIARRDLATVRARRLDILASAWKSYADVVMVLGALP